MRIDETRPGRTAADLAHPPWSRRFGLRTREAGGLKIPAGFLEVLPYGAVRDSERGGSLTNRQADHKAHDRARPAAWRHGGQGALDGNGGHCRCLCRGWRRDAEGRSLAALAPPPKTEGSGIHVTGWIWAPGHPAPAAKGPTECLLGHVLGRSRVGPTQLESSQEAGVVGSIALDEVGAGQSPLSHLAQGFPRLHPHHFDAGTAGRELPRGSRTRGRGRSG
jgi:hypothetical protein